MNQNLKVLIVDDNQNVRQQLRELLSTVPCDCFEAETGDEALAMIGKHKFAVLFLDMRLPFGVTGIEVLGQARVIQPDLGKVIILTGWLEDFDRELVIKLGAHAWLDKSPFDGDRILEAFHSAIAELGGDAA